MESSVGELTPGRATGQVIVDDEFDPAVLEALKGMKVDGNKASVYFVCLPRWPQRDRAGFGLQERGLFRTEIDEKVVP